MSPPSTIEPWRSQAVATRRVCALWAAIAGGLGLAAATLLLNRHRFDWAFELIQIPAIPFAIGLSLTGLLVMPLPWLIGRSGSLDASIQRGLLAMVIILGLALRSLLFATEPVLEDDYNRYLWDGAVAANGLNPYALAPGDAANEPDEAVVNRLAREAGVVRERINHPDLKTIYPPVAQAAFALAHWIKPWSLTAWRLVCLGGEAVTLVLLIALLSTAGRSPLWVALYWWNPMIIKELINSAHMEAIVMPLVLAALLLSVKRWPIASIAALGFAIGAKLWPALLAPLLLRPLLRDPKRLSMALALLGGIMALWVAAPLAGGIDETSGFVAYAANWATNSALFPAMQRLVAAVLGVAGLDTERAGQIVRGVDALVVGATALWLAVAPWTTPTDLIHKAGTITIVLFLVTPAQFPWYAAWMIPFLCFRPSLALVGVSVMLPIYYASFYFHAHGTYDVFRDRIVWLIWLPIWGGLLIEALRDWRTTDTSETSNA